MQIDGGRFKRVIGYVGAVSEAAIAAALDEEHDGPHGAPTLIALGPEAASLLMDDMRAQSEAARRHFTAAPDVETAAITKDGDIAFKLEGPPIRMTVSHDVPDGEIWLLWDAA